MRAHYLSLPAFGFAAAIGPIIFQDELPKRRRQVAAMSAAMNRSHNVLYARLVPGGNVLQSSPKGFFEADACPVTGDHDRPFNDRRLHRLFSTPVRLYTQVLSYVAGGPWFQADLSTTDVRLRHNPRQRGTSVGLCCFCFLRRMTAVFFRRMRTFPAVAPMSDVRVGSRPLSGPCKKSAAVRLNQ